MRQNELGGKVYFRRFVFVLSVRQSPIQKLSLLQTVSFLSF
jgi:hypothetical protein